MKNEAVRALVKARRRRLSLTQEQFAPRVGVTYGPVNPWENGNSRPLPFLLMPLLEIKGGLDAQHNQRATRRPPE
jgi:DNA-binding transcriptional regulator YiaG